MERRATATTAKPTLNTNSNMEPTYTRLPFLTTQHSLVMPKSIILHRFKYFRDAERGSFREKWGKSKGV